VGFPQRAWWLTTDLVPGALKLVSAPFVDMAGKASWGNMRRRTKTLFYRPEDFDERRDSVRRGRCPGSEDATPEPGFGTGALTRLLDALVAAQDERSRAFRFTLIGHSMGTLVLNEIVKRYGDLHFEHIVFMGAACSFKDFQDSIVPYLEQSQRNGSSCQFYNLCLHPAAETNERAAWNTVPRGSLLDWVDRYAAEPETPLDLTMGKWNNVMRALRTLSSLDEGVLARIHVTGFPYTDGAPVEHGDFNDAERRFWRPAFWDRADEHEEAGSEPGD
jgi:pimeloyl-ACP methyl ester carboxylesterase